MCAVISNFIKVLSFALKSLIQIIGSQGKTVTSLLIKCVEQWGPGHTEKPPRTLVKFKGWKSMGVGVGCDLEVMLIISTVTLR